MLAYIWVASPMHDLLISTPTLWSVLRTDYVCGWPWKELFIRSRVWVAQIISVLADFLPPLA